ncbi:MAG: hypothetical protein V4451_16840 [Pseudomonadota bacterium]
MKYQSMLDQIQSGRLTRDELAEVRRKAALPKYVNDADTAVILQAIDSAVARDTGIIFMGFCPNAEIANRLDTEWREKGICTFHYDEDPTQIYTFNNICAGDLIVLKKTETFGRTMVLYGHGRVTAVKAEKDGRRYLEMAWSRQDRELPGMPMMGCQATVNLRSMEKVEESLPPEFFAWLGEGVTASASNT